VYPDLAKRAAFHLGDKALHLDVDGVLGVFYEPLGHVGN
jgi:hypothetical protein